MLWKSKISQPGTRFILCSDDHKAGETLEKTRLLTTLTCFEMMEKSNRGWNAGLKARVRLCQYNLQIHTGA
jgi:hypothetical protein